MGGTCGRRRQSRKPKEFNVRRLPWHRGYRTAYPEVYTVPKLGGQHAQYIVSALQGYKSGARKNATMRAIASSLSDQDMADLAAYFSGEAQK